MPQDAWNPQQYERFKDERSQPFYDLLALVQPAAGGCAVDLGCGTGELTAVVHRHLQVRQTTGIDHSANMLEKSQAIAAAGLRFERAEIGEFARRCTQTPGAYDVVFSNAALHWLPQHEELLRGLTAGLRERGQIAVQVPANHDHPSHISAAEVAGGAPFRDALREPPRRKPVLDPEAYAVLLSRLGYREQHVRLQVYGHWLGSRDEVVEWVKGTLLTHYQRQLPAELFARFLERYRERLLPQLDDTRPYFYPFKRILFWARR